MQKLQFGKRVPVFWKDNFIDYEKLRFSYQFFDMGSVTLFIVGGAEDVKDNSRHNKL